MLQEDEVRREHEHDEHLIQTGHAAGVFANRLIFALLAFSGAVLSITSLFMAWSSRFSSLFGMPGTFPWWLGFLVLLTIMAATFVFLVAGRSVAGSRRASIPRPMVGTAGLLMAVCPVIAEVGYAHLASGFGWSGWDEFIVVADYWGDGLSLALTAGALVVAASLIRPTTAVESTAAWIGRFGATLSLLGLLVFLLFAVLESAVAGHSTTAHLKLFTLLGAGLAIAGGVGARVTWPRVDELNDTSNEGGAWRSALGCLLFFMIPLLAVILKAGDLIWNALDKAIKVETPHPIVGGVLMVAAGLGESAALFFLQRQLFEVWALWIPLMLIAAGGLALTTGVLGKKDEGREI